MGITRRTLLAERGLRTDRVAALGWSMGGYGALLCGLTAPQRVVAVAAGELTSVALRIDCGDDDPFAPAVRSLRRRLPDPSVVHLASGCHDPQFWQYAAPAQMAMIGAALQPTRSGR